MVMKFVWVLSRACKVTGFGEADWLYLKNHSNLTITLSLQDIHRTSSWEVLSTSASLIEQRTLCWAQFGNVCHFACNLAFQFSDTTAVIAGARHIEDEIAALHTIDSLFFQECSLSERIQTLAVLPINHVFISTIYTACGRLFSIFSVVFEIYIYFGLNEAIKTILGQSSLQFLPHIL